MLSSSVGSALTSITATSWRPGKTLDFDDGEACGPRAGLGEKCRV
jgi:hypothetical protein